MKMSTITTTEVQAIKTNVRTVFESASLIELAEGMAWYANAHNILAAVAIRHKVTTRVACGICAALSPGSPWERNLQDVQEFLRNPKAAVGVYGRRNRDKAKRILDREEPLDVLGGQKVRSFYLNLVSPTEDLAVTVDRHSKCLSFGITSERDSNAIVTRAEYQIVEQVTRELAEELRILPLQLQAVTWTVWRNKWGGVKS